VTHRRAVVVLAIAGASGAAFAAIVAPSAADEPPTSTIPRAALGAPSGADLAQHAKHGSRAEQTPPSSSGTSTHATTTTTETDASTTTNTSPASTPSACDDDAATAARERRHRAAVAEQRRRREAAAEAGGSATGGSDFVGGGPAGRTRSGGGRLPSLARGSAGDSCGGDQPKNATPDKPTEVGGVSRGSSSTARAPTPSNPTFSLATPGPGRVGVPNFFIDKFRIPPFLLPIYRAAGIQYDIPWQALAAINEIETDYGRNLSVSSAGARGWMQFIPSSWKRYGVDANADRRRDPYNPADAIFAAARYLKAAGGDKDLRKAVFAYNHADWYVDSVMLRAKLIGGLPAGLVGSLTGLTQGHFPVHARARYADSHRRATNIFARRGAPAIAAQDGVVRRVGQSVSRGKYVVLQDAYGNRYTYAHLGSVVEDYPVPKRQRVSAAQVAKELELPKDPAPSEAASAGRQRAPKVSRAKRTAAGSSATRPSAAPAAAPSVDVAKERLYAHPRRSNAYRAGGKQQLFQSGRLPGFTTFRSYFTEVFGLGRREVELKRLRKGSKVIAGTILGRLGERGEGSPHLEFSIRPAGRGAPKVDPKPILDGWKLLESTAVYRAAGKNPFFGSVGQTPTIGQVLLMSKEQLRSRIVADPRIDIYACGRKDIEGGQIDRRVLAVLEFLANSGLKPTVSALKCGHSFLTKSGNVSEHSSGNAVDIAAINGIPILGHQGKGSITETTIQRLLILQGNMKPHQIISLMTPADFGGAENILALSDHNDHIHVGFQPAGGAGGEGLLKPRQWPRLIDRLAHVDNPTVPTRPSRDAIPDED
jgi:Transglycosylase SLT domain/Peptidase family M23